MVRVTWYDNVKERRGIVIDWTEKGTGTYAIVMVNGIFVNIHIDKLTFEGWID